MTDIHPPMYFWILHVWCWLRGTALDKGPLLNIPFYIVVVIAIFACCRILNCSPWVSAIAGILWLLSGSHLSVVVETRQYCLLAAASVSFLFCLLRFLRSPSVTPPVIVLYFWISYPSAEVERDAILQAFTDRGYSVCRPTGKVCGFSEGYELRMPVEEPY